MARHHTSSTHRAGQVLAGAAALLTLLALFVGVPVLLTTLAGNPLPHSVPSLSDVGHALTARDNGQLFLRALTVVAWLAWAVFALSVLVEIPAALRRRPAVRMPGLALPQRAAASLITAVTLMLHSPAMASAASAAPLTVATQSAAVSNLTGQPPAQLLSMANRHPPLHVLAASTEAPARAEADQSKLVYQVERGDWLGYIAERYLGDFDRYHDIRSLNRDLIEDPNVIQPYWRLILPTDARDRGPRLHARGHLIVPPADADDRAPNQPGSSDSPSQGDGHYSPGSTPPGGPGSPTPSVAASPNASGSATSASSATPGAVPSSDVAAGTPAPQGTPTTTRGPGRADTPHGPNGHQPAEDDSMLDHAIVVGVPLLGAGLLAALALTRLRRRRRRQEQHRPVGRRIPGPVHAETETDLRLVAQPVAVDRLDHALRALAASLVDRPSEQMPDIVGAWLDADTVNLLLTQECPDPPAPWNGDDLCWTLPADVDLPDVDGQLAPLPALVAVGSQPGTHLLLDLERLGLLTVTGDPLRARDLLRYLAAELACNAWSDHVDITVAGFDAEETAELLALGADRIDAAPSISAAVQRIRRRGSQVVQSLDHLGASDPLTGRIADVAADAWMPHVLLAHDPSPDGLAELEALDSDLAAAGRCAVAAVVTTGEESGRWPISIDRAGRLTVTFLGMTDDDACLTAAGLPRAELTKLADLLDAARQAVAEDGLASQPPASPEEWPTVPPAPETEPWADGTDAAGGLLADVEDADEAPEQADDEYDPTDDEAPAPEPSARTAQEQGARSNLSPGARLEGAVPRQREPDPAAQVPAVVPLPGRQRPTRRRPATPGRGRRHSDPTLDADIVAWTEADPTRPRIAILGPVTVEAPGHVPNERPRFYAEIIVYLAVRGARGATTDQFDEALWPGQQVKATSRRVAVARARRWLGQTRDGVPWLPDATPDRRYHLRDGYLLDWHLFRRLRSRGESRGPAGISDLQTALSLIRGAPLAGADIAYSTAARNPYVWLPTSEIQPHHLAAGVVDTAHRLVELCMDGGDLPGVRWAVEQAWLADADRASDIAWRDLFRVAAGEGNAAELDQLLGELMRARDAEVPEDLDKGTYRLLCELMPDRMRAGVR